MWREKLGNNHSKTDMNVFQICATLNYDVIKRMWFKRKQQKLELWYLAPKKDEGRNNLLKEI